MTLEQAPDSNSVSPDMRAHIGATLRDVEHEHNVTILFAVESGHARGVLHRPIATMMFDLYMCMKGIGTRACVRGAT